MHDVHTHVTGGVIFDTLINYHEWRAEVNHNYSQPNHDDKTPSGYDMLERWVFCQSNKQGLHNQAFWYNSGITRRFGTAPE